MKHVASKILRVMLKLALLAGIILSVPSSVLLALEYISPVLGLFPLYTISVISLMWILVLAVPFFVSRATRASAEAGEQDSQATVRKQGFWPSAFGWASGLRLRLMTRIVDENKIPHFGARSAHSSAASGHQVKTAERRGNDVSAVLLTIDKRKVVRTRASKAKSF